MAHKKSDELIININCFDLISIVTINFRGIHIQLLILIVLSFINILMVNEIKL
jgi:hypothetical protein